MVNFNSAPYSAAAPSTASQSPSPSLPGSLDETPFTQGQKIRVITNNDETAPYELTFISYLTRDKKYLVGRLDNETIVELPCKQITSTTVLNKEQPDATSLAKLKNLEKILRVDPPEDDRAIKAAITIAERQRRENLAAAAAAPPPAVVIAQETPLVIRQISTREVVCACVIL